MNWKGCGIKKQFLIESITHKFSLEELRKTTEYLSWDSCSPDYDLNF
jgi:hypothetical protein